MGISLEQYRIQIGIHFINGRNSQFKIRKSDAPSTKKSKLLTLFLLVFLFTHNPSIYFLNSSNDDIIRPNSVSKPRCDTYNIECNHLTTMVSPGMDLIEKTTSAMFLCWSHSSSTTNALCHALIGNRRRLGYKLALWNCRKGLLGDKNYDSSKLTEIKLFIQKHNPHTFGIIESNIHALNSRVQRKTTFKTREVESNLNIDGYKIELPDTWNDFGQARILVYVKNDINYKRQRMPSDTDLPNVTLEIGLGRERRQL
jgi:hypothetical protein